MDGAGAVIVEGKPGEGGLLGAHLACTPGPGTALMAPDLGTPPSPPGERKPPELMFDGKEVFRHAVPGMVKASHAALAKAAIAIDSIDLLIPHQANLRIIDAVGKKLPLSPDKVVTNLQRYGNTSAASIPIAMCDALETGMIQPEATILMAAFGAGLTSAAAVMRWGNSVTAAAESAVELPACHQTAREIIQPALEFQQAYHATNPA